MMGFLQRLTQRAAGRAEGLHPRVPMPFEPGQNSTPSVAAVAGGAHTQRPSAPTRSPGQPLDPPGPPAAPARTRPVTGPDASGLREPSTTAPAAKEIDVPRAYASTAAVSRRDVQAEPGAPVERTEAGHAGRTIPTPAGRDDAVPLEDDAATRTTVTPRANTEALVAPDRADAPPSNPVVAGRRAPRSPLIPGTRVPHDARGEARELGASEPERVVRVTIERLDVHAAVPPRSERRARPAQSRPDTLADYVRRRREAKR